MAAADSQENAIVVYLNHNKTAQDVGNFTFVNTFDISAEEANKKAVSDATTASDLAGTTVKNSVYNEVYKKSMQKYTYNAITQAIKQTLNIANETIKLIILELIGNKLTLDCDAFLLNSKNMGSNRYYDNLNHVIIGKRGDTYDVIGYIETPIKQSSRTKDKICTTFILKLSGPANACAVLPEIIKETIFKCIKAHYVQNIPDPIRNYYNPTTEEYKKEVVAERAADARAAEEEAAAEIKDTDQCDFKVLLKSKIKNNESNEYCKVTDPGLLERIQQNIDGNKVDVDINGVNDLIKTRLANLKKVKEEEDADEDEEKEREDGKTISEKKEAFMIKEANEMYVITREVSKKISEGTTYSSEEFFKEYLKNTTVMEQEEKDDEPVAAAVAVTEAEAQEPQVATITQAPVTEVSPVTETTAATTEAAAPAVEQVAEVPGPKEVTPSPPPPPPPPSPPPPQNFKGIVKTVRTINKIKKTPDSAFFYS